MTAPVFDGDGDRALLAALGVSCQSGEGDHSCRVHDSTWHPAGVSPDVPDVCWVMRHRLDGVRLGIDLARNGIADDLLAMAEPEAWPSRYTAEAVLTAQEWLPLGMESLT